MRRIFSRLVCVAMLVASWSPLATAADPPADPFAQAATASPNPFRTAAAADSKTARAASDQSLLDARRAMTVGDLARAQQFLGQAQQLGVAYDGPGDSPQKVAESIAKGLELAELKKSSRGGDAWRAQYAKFLVAQADALTTWSDYDTATRAANEAEQLFPSFPATGLTPKSVLARIAEAKRGAAPGGIANPAAVAATPAQPGSIAEAKSQTLTLLSQARTALAGGDLATAEQLAGQASALNVPESQLADGRGFDAGSRREPDDQPDGSWPGGDLDPRSR
jgi:hypothetical protein